jgi:glutamyl-tRNA synthetase
MTTDRPVRVRVAPSPTGEPHVGTAYIALFNLAFARKNGGKFVLRIEDTDRERSRQEWEDEIIEGLRWLGLTWDEGPDVGGPFGPYRQSERSAIYHQHIELLLEKGEAYRCFATPEELAQLREEQRARKETSRYDGRWRDRSPAEVKAAMDAGLPFVVRMKMPLEGETVLFDELRGEVRIDNRQVDDQILMKSDGFPTYHLANVVDDHLMGISHVIRAEEWISSTPKHVVLYRAFGWEPPKFIHMPLLRNADKSKISKRKNPVSLLDYKSRGFLPEAVLNYLAMLGFSMPDEREMFTVEEFFENFTWDRMSLGGPTFDLAKLTWLNGRYYREKLSDDAWVKLLRDDLLSEEILRKLVPLIKERIDTSEQFIPAVDYFFSGELAYDASMLVSKGKTPKETREVLEKYGDEIDRQVDFSAPALEALSRGFAEAQGWKVKDLFMPLRVAMTGRTATPPLFDTLSVLGRAKVRRRLRQAQDLLKALAEAENKKK